MPGENPPVSGPPVVEPPVPPQPPAVLVNWPSALSFELMFERFGIPSVMGLLARSGGNMDEVVWWVYDRLGQSDGGVWFERQFIDRGFGGERAVNDLLGRRSYAGHFLNLHFNAGIVGDSAPFQAEWGGREAVAAAVARGWKTWEGFHDPDPPVVEIEYPCFWSVVGPGAGKEGMYV